MTFFFNRGLDGHFFLFYLTLLFFMKFNVFCFFLVVEFFFIFFCNVELKRGLLKKPKMGSVDLVAMESKLIGLLSEHRAVVKSKIACNWRLTELKNQSDKLVQDLEAMSTIIEYIKTLPVPSGDLPVMQSKLLAVLDQHRAVNKLKTECCYQLGEFSNQSTRMIQDMAAMSTIIEYIRKQETPQANAGDEGPNVVNGSEDSDAAKTQIAEADISLGLKTASAPYNEVPPKTSLLDLFEINQSDLKRIQARAQLWPSHVRPIREETKDPDPVNLLLTPVQTPQIGEVLTPLRAARNKLYQRWLNSAHNPDSQEVKPNKPPMETGSYALDDPNMVMYVKQSKEDEKDPVDLNEQTLEGLQARREEQATKHENINLDGFAKNADETIETLQARAEQSKRPHPFSNTILNF